MTPFLTYLADKPIPGWAMLHNARISFNAGEGHQVSSFEEIYWSDSITELRSKISVPKLLDNREAQEMASFRFSEEELRLEKFSFDEMPGALMSESTDMDLFGESWVIFWVVPPDKEMIMNLLLDKLERECAERIEAKQLKEIWDDYLNRIFFRHDGDGDLVELTHLYDEVHEEIIERINASEKAPEESAWDILDENALLGGEDDW